MENFDLINSKDVYEFLGKLITDINADIDRSIAHVNWLEKLRDELETKIKE